MVSECESTEAAALGLFISNFVFFIFVKLLIFC